MEGVGNIRLPPGRETSGLAGRQVWEDFFFTFVTTEIQIMKVMLFIRIEINESQKAK